MNDRCPNCGNSDISDRIVSEVIPYGSGTDAAQIPVELSIRHCNSCAEEWEDADSFRVKHDAVCKHLGRLTSREVLGIRTAIGSRERFSELTGIGPASLARWESGNLIRNCGIRPAGSRCRRRFHPRQTIFPEGRDRRHPPSAGRHTCRTSSRRRHQHDCVIQRYGDSLPWACSIKRRSRGETRRGQTLLDYDVPTEQGRNPASERVMHVVTFYSFKGGVGRTMALVNVAGYLAKTGRKVMVVDFDLEAPGLTTYDLPRPASKPQSGLVEFVTDYIETGEVPDVSNYVYRSELFPGGELVVMPAGAIDETYQSRFRSIDFARLYAEHDGFLLFEDLRKQWQTVFGVDYVLIDSRTGYSDIAGICTRQLPDAVCLMFIPNKQNLVGLTRIQSEIQAQRSEPQLRQPKVLYVASNVPDLDDEENILATMLQTYKEQLGFKELTAKIGQYRSLALLNQEVFTILRPKTALAKDYECLANEIARTNPEDLAASLDFLKSLSRQLANSQMPVDLKTLTERIDDITAKHDSADIFYWAGRAKGEIGDWEDAKALLTQSIDAGNDNADVHLHRAYISSSLGNSTETKDDARWVLSQVQGVQLPAVLAALHLLLRYKGVDASEAVRFPAIRALNVDDRLFLSHSIYDAKTYPAIAQLLLRTSSTAKRLSKSVRDDVLYELANSSMAIGDLDEAARLLEERNPSQDFDARDAFNLGMARYWQGDHATGRKLMSVVVEQLAQKQGDDSTSLNQMQCLAFANWVIGEVPTAKKLLTRIKGRAAFQPRPTFSCWRYMNSHPRRLSSRPRRNGTLCLMALMSFRDF